VVAATYTDVGQTRYTAPLILLNDGNGASFTTKPGAMPPQYLGVDGSVVDINPGDYNHDGKIDLLVITVDNRRSSYYESSQIQLYLGNGDGSFVDATSCHITSGNWPKDLCANCTGWAEFLRLADFDGDGNVDFIASSFSANSGTIYRSDSSGRFAPAPVSVSLNAMVANPMTPNALGMLAARDVLVADMDGDGYPDVLSYVSNLPVPVAVDAYINNGHGVFARDNTVFLPSQPMVHGPRNVLVADLDGDGRKDVFFANSGADFDPFFGAANLLLVNNGAGKLVDQTASRLNLQASYTHRSALGDLTGDGLPDLLLNNSDSRQARFWANSASGVFKSFSPSIR
jgi:hypothetical protein